MWMDPVSIRLVGAQLLKASGFICITLRKVFPAEGSHCCTCLLLDPYVVIINVAFIVLFAQNG